MEDYLSVGKIINTHGVKGEVRVTPQTSDISRFDYLLFTHVEQGGKLKELRVTQVRYHKNFVLLKFNGIDTMDDAEALKGCELLVERKNARPLEEDEFFICDLIGLMVYEGEELLGKISEVLETGSNDVYVVKGKDRDILIPALKSVVLDVDIPGGKMMVKLPEGLLDEV